MMKHFSEPGKAQPTRDKFNVASIQNVDATQYVFFYYKQIKSNVVLAEDCWYDKRN